jgi:putative acetyltransferase
VHEEAFGQAIEGAIVDALRAAGAIFLSMVAVIDVEDTPDEQLVATEPASVTVRGGEGTAWGEASGKVAGHVLISEVTVTTERGEVPLLGMGPVGVLPEHQEQGVGTMLVDACLERLRKSGRAGVVVVGHPDYYPRFGFIPASRWGLYWEEEVPDEVFMALELSPGQLSAVRGEVRYRPEFSLSSAR